jgi:phage FluMu gp28-like protein
MACHASQLKPVPFVILEFSNGSKVQAVPTGTDAGRSEALSLPIIDEAAHVDGIDELWLGLAYTIYRW